MSNAADLVKALRNVETFGASTSGTAAANLTAINAAITYFNSIGGGTVLFPDFYDVSEPPLMKDNVVLMGLGYGTGFRNTDTSNTWDAAGIFFGNYGTATASAITESIPSAYAETAYNVSAISAGARTVTTSTASDAGNFADGDVVMICSAERTSTGYPKYQMLNEANGAGNSGTGVITLKHKIPDAMAVSTTEGELHFSSASAQFVAGRTLTGGTSGATCTILGVFMGSNIKYVGVDTIASGPFQAGETVTESVSGNTAVIATGGVRLNPTIRKLNTGNVTGLDGTAAKVVVRGGLKNMRIEQAKTSGNAYQCVHFAAYESDFENLWLVGQDALGGNPMGFCRWENVRASYRRQGAEIAYCCNNNTIDTLVMARVADYATAQQAAMLLNEDGGADNLIINPQVLGEFGTVSTQAAIASSKLRTRIIDPYVNGSIGSGIELVSGSDFSKILGGMIQNPGTNGIAVHSDSCEVGGVTIRGAPASSKAIRMRNTSSYCVVHDNILGDKSSPQAQDVISDDNGETTTNLYSNNGSKISQARRCEPQGTAYNTASESTLETYSIEANTAIIGMAWVVEWYGSIAGTNGQKDIRIKVAGTTIATQTMAAGTTGAFYGRAVVGTGSSGNYTARGIQDTAGTLAAITGSNGIANAFTNATDIILTAQLASASDTITLRHFSVTPMGDQFQ